MNLTLTLLGVFRKKETPAHTEAPCIYRSLFNAADDGMIIYSDETLEILDVNESLHKLLKLPEDRKVNGLYLVQMMMRYLAGDSPNLELLMNEPRQNWTGEAVLLTHQKERCHVRVSMGALEGTEPLTRHITIRDSGEQKEKARELLVAKQKVEDAARSKARFLSSMSHELRTPLNGVIGTANLILSDPACTENMKQQLSVIRYSSEHMLALVNDILDFSKIDAGKMSINEKPFNISNCLRNVSSAFSHQFQNQGLAFTADVFDGSEDDLQVIGDEIKLSQVLKNLLSNALKFTPQGAVSLSARIVTATDESVEIFFEVKDSGIGIPKEKQEEVFQAFVQLFHEDLKRKYDGSGLGLAISSQLVQMMGSSLQLESAPDEGSRFFFTLKFQKSLSSTAPGEESTKDVVTDSGDIRGVRALIVEDNEVNAGILRSFLTRWKMPVKEAMTGVHALELLKYHKFDVVLMDLEMPEMNGYTTLKKMREQHLDIPVIAFTATLLDDMESLITQAGFTDYISKPFKPSELKHKISKYSRRKVDYV